MASSVQTISLGLPAQQPEDSRAIKADPTFDALMASRVKAAAPTPSLVAPVRTRLDGNQAADALRAAWTDVTGQPPSEQTVAVLTAQWAHETGNGASMYNYNFGGIKGTGPSGIAVAQRTKEGYGASEHTITDRFRAYRTAEEGATDYVKLITQHFPEAAKSAQNGDPAGFVAGLKQRGYFTGDPIAYTRSVSTLTAQGLSQGFGAVGSHLGELGAPPELNLHATPLAAQNYADYQFGPQPSAPLIDALRIGDEISRAALRIVASSDSKDG
ncbi:MAG TPA: glucosaminidase domain-containing protein [Polyangiaceae bacterium]